MTDEEAIARVEAMIAIQTAATRAAERYFKAMPDLAKGHDLTGAALVLVLALARARVRTAREVQAWIADHARREPGEAHQRAGFGRE
jgi:hypothetical protein